MTGYKEKIYAGWLSKLAGIRLGAPIEGWTYERIAEELGEIDGYVTDISRFAADDDSNGPAMFIRALTDYSIDITSEQIGEGWLNYSPYEHGMFWWGGYGVSTEHTAYLNLASGIKAPRSGSISQNGSTVAEQIGGQIFIDPWGYVCPGNPAKAAEYASKAASVSHDGNARYGAIFVATAIAIAFEEADIRNVITAALKFIPENCEYARAVRSVMMFHDEQPDSWRECFKYVHDYWGYDRYPGNCHIIPNTAVMILSMLYGEGDFDKTLNICCMCGWDTDCNAGNVASIIGVMVGLDGINYDKWLKPINDGCALSSVFGCLNYLDAPWFAGYLNNIAMRIAGEKVDPIVFDKRLYDFELRGSTHSFESDTAKLTNTGGALLCEYYKEFNVFRRAYRTPDYFMDDRYSPEMTPEVFPGQTIRFVVSGDSVSVTPYAALLDGRVIAGEEVLLSGEREISVHIPKMDSVCVERYGIRCDKGIVVLRSAEVTGNPDYSCDFSMLKMEKHGVVSQFSRWKGICGKEGDALTLSCADAGAIFTGDLSWSDYAFEAEFTPMSMGGCEMLVGVTGAHRHIAVSLNPSGLEIISRNIEQKLVASTDHEFTLGKAYRLRVEFTDSLVSVIENGNTVLAANVTGYSHGAIGLGNRRGGHMCVKSFSVSPLANG